MTRTERLRYQILFGAEPRSAKKTVRRKAAESPATDPEFERSLRDYQVAQIEANSRRVNWRNLPLLLALMDSRGKGESRMTDCAPGPCKVYS